ncbi:hypothetical protein KL907_002749 [Ogataea polymorpha]|nr:hypothetical protein KL937_001733 [Ogataea polymorpha]KAG7893626.1 hypothetical protein KL908_002680 [Ogataea polymorpha]KAG7905602.1 hypothetical protein KL907_002749 [Ogataea polymorpha]KAG7909503.1 hypothetical protein KL906_002259 [Ogataea polymorpha]KAG7917023.1 hypothetical protein KL927_002797 [Ogataea polymorpha]
MVADTQVMAAFVSSFNCNDWALGLAAVADNVAVAASSGKIHVLSKTLQSTSTLSAHSRSINKIRALDSYTFASCSNDGTVKVWDARTNRETLTLSNARQLPFLSLDTSYNLLVAGTELSGSDSELILWDLRKPTQPLRTFIDSHNDDITEARFHPSSRQLLLSGSTDGYVNIYDLSVPEEDDALLQVINFTSIHSANFLSPNRIYTLSHMETFAVHELNDHRTEEHIEPQPKQFGDVREKWGCEYVVDLQAPGYVFCGSNSKHELKMHRFDPAVENFDFSGESPVYFPDAHGEEVVRDALVLDNMVYTAGEDNLVKLWKTPCLLADTSAAFFSSAPQPVETKQQEPKPESDRKHRKKKHKKDSKRFRPY